jgi:hypothetical protein
MSLGPIFLRIAAAFTALALAQSTAQSDSVPAPVSDPPASISLAAPEGWDLMPGHSEKISTTASQTAYFGEEPISTGALAYRRADQGALYLTWVDSTRAHPSPEAGLRTAFDELHEAPFLATTERESTQEILYRERNFDGVAELRFEWAHLNNDTVNLVRALGWKDSDGRVHLAIAECVLHSENAPEVRPICQTALEGLHLNKAANHKALRSLTPPKRVGDGLRAEDIQVPKLTTGETSPGSTMGSPPRNIGEVLYNGPPPPAAKDKSNRFFIAIGVLLLIAAVWLTSRSNDSSSPEDDESDAEAPGEDDTDGSQQDESDDESDDEDAKQEKEKAE